MISDQNEDHEVRMSTIHEDFIETFSNVNGINRTNNSIPF